MKPITLQSHIMNELWYHFNTKWANKTILETLVSSYDNFLELLCFGTISEIKLDLGLISLSLKNLS